MNEISACLSEHFVNFDVHAFALDLMPLMVSFLVAFDARSCGEKSTFFLLLLLLSVRFYFISNETDFESLFRINSLASHRFQIHFKLIQL